MVKLALIDWDDTLVNRDNSLRAQVMTDILRHYSDIVSPAILERVQNDFAILIEEARQYAKKNALNPKSVTVLFDYLFIQVGEPKRSTLIKQTQKIYREDIAKKLSLYPGALEQLQRLKGQGYTLAVISNKSEDNMHIEYEAVVKNYPQLAELIPVDQVFATNVPAHEKPNDFLHRQALTTLHNDQIIQLTDAPLELLIIGDSLSRDGEATKKCHQTLFDSSSDFRPLPNPYTSQVLFALFDPNKQYKQEVLVPFQLQGIDAFSVNSWNSLGELLAGDKKNTQGPKHAHSEDEIKALAARYLKDSRAGYYMLRTQPRCWAQITADNQLVLGTNAQPSSNGNWEVTFVDVDEALEANRTRYYKQNTFVHEGKVFNAAAYVYFKDPKGMDYILFIKDKRNWNVPIGRVDGDELAKVSNHALLNKVRGTGPAKTHCMLAAFRELQEETGFDISPFVTKKETRIIPYSSDDISGRVLNNESNFLTTVTMQVVIDLGTLTTQEIQHIQEQLRPQADEHIEKAQLIAVTHIQKEKDQYYFWQKPGSDEKNPIFRHVGQVITTLKEQRLMPFNTAPSIQEKQEEPASWYVMVTNQQIPIDATIYQPNHYLNEQRTAEELQKDMTLCQQMTGIEVFNFSPIRLALHETIMALSIYNTWASEDLFVNSVASIYEERVKPLVRRYEGEFKAIIKLQTEEVTALMKKNGLQDISSSAAQLILSARQSYERALNSHGLRYENLDAKIKEYNASKPGSSRPTLAERDEHQGLDILINTAKKNAGFIIQQTVVSQLVYKNTTQLLRSLLFEQKAGAAHPLLRSEELAKHYKLKPKTFYSNEQRRSLLVVGGPASGKGRVTEQQLCIFNHDVLELNPDLYKKLLLPMSAIPEEVKKHGSLTHNESSMVFDNLVEYWGKLAALGFAPHTLIDVGRAGAWIRSKLSIGTQIEAHSPLLSVLDALKRSYDRGLQTGRFMPTALLIQSHRDQVSVNLEAMRSGCAFTFYDTSVGFHEELTVVAKYLIQAKKLDIYKLSSMLEYFQKADLNINAFDESSLWGHTPKSTVHYILSYANHMALHFYDKQELFAQLEKNAHGQYTLQINNWTALKNQLSSQCEYFIQGLIEQGVHIAHVSDELNVLIHAIEQRLKQVKPGVLPLITKTEIQFDEQQCINTACMIVEQGVDYVRSAHGLWIYTPPKSDNEFNRLFPKGINILKTTEYGDRKINSYKPGQQLTFDIREYPTLESCELEIKKLQEHGIIQSQHIAMNLHVQANYVRPESTPENENTIQWYVALPKRVRAFLVDDPKTVQIVNSHGFPVRPKRKGWVKCSDEYLDTLTLAVNEFRAHPNEQSKNSLLQASFGHLYCSGPFNIEDGYDYYVCQTELKNVLGQLQREPSLYKNKHSNELFTCIKLNTPLNLKSNERIEADSYLVLAEKDRTALSRILTQMDSTTIDLDKIPELRVLHEDDVRRTYSLAYLEASAVKLLQEAVSDSSAGSSHSNPRLGQLLKKDLISFYSSLRNRFLQEKNPLLTPMPELRDEVESMLEELYHPFIENLISHQKKTGTFDTEISPLELARNTCITELRSVLLRQVLDTHPDMATYPYSPIASGRLPYVPTVTALSKALDFFDLVERTTKTNVPNLYHSDRYTHYEQQLPLDLASGITLPFSGILTLTDLIRLRSVPLWVTGVSVKTVFADAFYNSPKDFYVHDVNHNRRFRGYNDRYFEKNNIVTEEGRFAAYQEFYKTIETLIIPSFKIVPTDSPEDKLLKLTIKTFYFEFLHEYSFPPDRDFLLQALKYRSGDPGPFEVYVTQDDSSKASVRESIAARRMKNNNLQSGFSLFEHHQPNQLLDVFLYHDSQSPNIITALFNKLSSEFYDSEFFRIKDIPAKKHRGPDLVVKAIKVVMATFKIHPEEIGLTAETLDQSLLELATNKKIDGTQLGHIDKYIHKLEKPGLRREVVDKVILPEREKELQNKKAHKFFRNKQTNDDLAALTTKEDINKNRP